MAFPFLGFTSEPTRVLGALRAQGAPTPCRLMAPSPGPPSSVFSPSLAHFSWEEALTLSRELMTLFPTALYLLVCGVLATPLRSLANGILAASKATGPFFSLLNLCDFIVPPFPHLIAVMTVLTSMSCCEVSVIIYHGG